MRTSKRRPFSVSTACAIVALLVAVLLLLPLGPSSRSYADPPPWAPAHGYYKNKHKNKHKQKRGSDYQYHDSEISQPIFVSEGHCNREEIGQALGAVLGGVVGARVTEGDNRPIGVIAGAIIGYIVGGSIGRSMDERDRACVGQALEYAEDDETISWRNPDQQTLYRVTPTRTYEAEDNYCREYTREAVIGDRKQIVVGEACRQPDGQWKIIR